MWRRVDLVKIGVWDERIASIISVTRMRALGTRLAVANSYLFTANIVLARRFLSH
jgi:hypothetical protein